MKIREIIIERVSSIIYHATGFPGGTKMLRANFMKANDNISFSRSIGGAYPKANKIIGVIFEFDGDKLNQKYKGAPVGTEDWDNNVEYRGRRNEQLEDRLYTKDGIKNVISYITKAILYLPIEYLDRHEDKFEDQYADSISYLKPLLQQLKRHNIPVRVVASEKDLIQSNKNDRKGFRLALQKMADNDLLDDETLAYVGIK